LPGKDKDPQGFVVIIGLGNSRESQGTKKECSKNSHWFKSGFLCIRDFDCASSSQNEFVSLLLGFMAFYFEEFW
jgi:hypothetical protein